MNRHHEWSDENDARRSGESRRIFVGAVMLFVLGFLAIEVFQRGDSEFNPLQFVRRPGNVQTRDDAALLSGWLDEVDNSWEVGKNHQLVRSAFKNVVADARQATVRVLRNGQQVALGTIIDSNGYVLTKASEVVGEGAKISCQLADRRKRSAEVVGVLHSHDLAMLRIRASGLPTVKWETSQAPDVGSLLATPHHGKEPLAVGVVSLAPLTVDNDSVLGIKLIDKPAGPLVTVVVPSSAADLAGIKDGDIVLKIDENSLADSNQLVEVISKRLPGDKVEVLISRSGEDLKLDATLGRRADLEQDGSSFQSFVGGKLSFRRSGFSSVLQHDTFLLPEPLRWSCREPGRQSGWNQHRPSRANRQLRPASFVGTPLARRP